MNDTKKGKGRQTVAVADLGTCATATTNSVDIGLMYLQTQTEAATVCDAIECDRNDT